MREKTSINDRTKENLLFDGVGEHYGIYQLKESEERTYQFMGMREASSLGFEIHGEDYELIYSDRLGMEDTLDSLYEKFNINHPQDFTGHSLSVSDVVVMRKNGEAKAYYVDSFGFTELPEFIHERLRLQEIPHVTEQTSGLMVEGHMGTWHTIGQQEYHGELFFLMRHDEYGSEVSDIIVSENGTLVAENLQNGFDVEAGLAISEYLEENGASVYDLMELPAGTDIILYDGKELYTDKAQPIINDSWDYSMSGIDKNGESTNLIFTKFIVLRLKKD